MSLRKLSKHPGTWLAVFGFLLLLAFADTFRAPENQVTGRIYVGAVRFYQGIRGEGLKKFILCRYEPSCSEYSIEAVERHGLRRGLVLTVKRLARCRKNVKPGTLDPVP